MTKDYITLISSNSNCKPSNLKRK